MAQNQFVSWILYFDSLLSRWGFFFMQIVSLLIHRKILNVVSDCMNIFSVSALYNKMSNKHYCNILQRRSLLHEVFAKSTSCAKFGSNRCFKRQTFVNSYSMVKVSLQLKVTIIPLLLVLLNNLKVYAAFLSFIIIMFLKIIDSTFYQTNLFNVHLDR